MNDQTPEKASNVVRAVDITQVTEIDRLYARWTNLSADIEEAQDVPNDDPRIKELAELERAILDEPSDTVRALHIKIVITHSDESECLNKGQVIVMEEAKFELALLPDDAHRLQLLKRASRISGLSLDALVDLTDGLDLTSVAAIALRAALLRPTKH